MPPSGPPSAAEPGLFIFTSKHILFEARFQLPSPETLCPLVISLFRDPYYLTFSRDCQYLPLFPSNPNPLTVSTKVSPAQPPSRPLPISPPSLPPATAFPPVSSALPLPHPPSLPLLPPLGPLSLSPPQPLPSPHLQHRGLAVLVCFTLHLGRNK